MLSTEFTFNLTEPILAGKVTIGYFDGVHPSIVAVTRSDKIFVHNPHNRSVYDPNSNSALNEFGADNNGDENNNASGIVVDSAIVSNFTAASGGGNDLDFLNINQTIVCIAAGAISSRRESSSSTGIGGGDNHGETSITGIGSSGSGSGRIAGMRKAANESRRRKSLNKRRREAGQVETNDVLVVGTKTSVHVYDILHNCDLYYKEIPDGANAITIGQFGDAADGPLAMIGGNCAIHGFDRDGNDAYWTVTGDNISAIALVDIDGDGQNELVVGSEDNEIQVFKRDAIIFEQTEMDRISCLCALGPQLFAYALTNGTVGVYQSSGERLWRIKSKNTPIQLLAVDVNADGHLELLTGWSNGKLDIRAPLSGEVLHRESFRSSIAGMMFADYDMNGQRELIVCTVTGEVIGFRLQSGDGEISRQSTPITMIDSTFEHDTIRELMRQRQTLTQELRNYEENYRLQNIADPPQMMLNRGKMLNEQGELYGAIPAATKIQSSLLQRQGSPGLIELQLQTTNDTHIRAAIVFAEGIFKHESVVVYPREDEVCGSISVELRPPKDTSYDLHVKALVGYRASAHFHVFEIVRHLPRFSMFAYVRAAILPLSRDHQQPPQRSSSPTSDEGFNEPPNGENKIHKSASSLWDSVLDSTASSQIRSQTRPNEAPIIGATAPPQSYCIFRINDSIGKVIEWTNQNFLLDREIESNETERRLEFVSLRDGSALIIEIRHDTGNRGSKRRVTLQPSASVASDNLDIDEGLFADALDNTTTTANDSNSFQSAQSTTSRRRRQDSLAYDLSNIVTIRCDSIDVAGNCVQSLAGDFLAIGNLPCARAHFPGEMTRLRELIARVEEIQSVRQHLVAEVADSANLIRSAVVQAEDCRLIEEFNRMKQIYSDLAMLNREILREHTIRCRNHQDLVDSLKQINVIIQRASNLRVGTFKTALISACREAIKQKNFAQLYKIITED